MRLPVLLAALLALPGCSLDIDRLYGALDDAGPPRDGGARDASHEDASHEDGGELDGGDVDGGQVDGGGTDPVGLIVAATLTLAGPSDALAAGPIQDGAVLAVAGRSLEAMSVWRLVPGSDCSLVPSVAGVPAIAQAGPVAVALLDDDPLADVIVGTDTQVLFGFGTSGGSYTLSGYVDHPLGELAAISIGDLDRDGRPEVVLTSRGPAIGWLRQGSSRTFTYVPGPMGSGLVYRDGVAGDLDADGTTDLGAISDASSTTTALVLRGNGTGGLFGPVSDVIPMPAARLAVWSEPDAAARLVAVGGGELWIGGLEAGALAGERTAIVDAELTDVVVAELDGVAPAEIVVADASISALRILHDRGDALVRAMPDVPVTGAATALARLDTELDGVDEVAVLIGAQVLVVRRACD